MLNSNDTYYSFLIRSIRSSSVNVDQDTSITTFLLTDYDLNVVLDATNITWDFSTKMLSNRSLNNADYWLINSTGMPDSYLKQFKMDLDDDIYLFESQNNNSIAIWETYKV
jgi:hypothetical protein